MQFDGARLAWRSGHATRRAAASSPAVWRGTETQQPPAPECTAGRTRETPKRAATGHRPCDKLPRLRSALKPLSTTTPTSPAACTASAMREARAAKLVALNERILAGLRVLVIYIGGIVADGHDILAAVGVDEIG